MFHGSLVALVTPMLRDGSIDHTALAELVEWHISQQIDGFVVNGTTGESATLTHKEQLDIITTVLNQTKNRVPVIAGTYATSTAQAISLTTAAMEAGVSASLIMTPAYIKPTQAGIIKHYQAIANACALPIILYNHPGRTGTLQQAETIATLAQTANIIGLKDATADLDFIQTVKQRCGESLDILSGDDASTIGLMTCGAKGVISITANLAPKLMQESIQAALKGDYEKAQQIQQALLPLHQALVSETNPIPVKWAAFHLGLIPEGIRLPLTELTEQNQTQVRQILQQLGLQPRGSQHAAS